MAASMKWRNGVSIIEMAASKAASKINGMKYENNGERKSMAAISEN
jgi:hypothetical protein